MDTSQNMSIASGESGAGEVSVRQLAAIPEDEEAQATPTTVMDFLKADGGLTITVKNEFAVGSGNPEDSFALGDLPRFVQRWNTSSIGRSSSASVTTTFAEELETKYLQNRHEIIREDGSINTPLYVLREMAREYGTPVHMEFHEVRLNRFEKCYFVEIYVGRLKGCGEASRRKLAMHIASADLLEKMRAQNADTLEIPAYALLPGCRINPSIFGELYVLCQEFELESPLFVEMPIDPMAVDPPRYTYKCQIGQLIVNGYSDSRYLAKRWAAKKLYEALTGETVPMEPVAHGAYCSALEQLRLKPLTSQHKKGVLKYREESREGSTGTASVEGPDTGAHSECGDEDGPRDDFRDALDVEGSAVVGVAYESHRPKRSQGTIDLVKARLLGMNVYGQERAEGGEPEDLSMVIDE